jgi:hypothetical protein
MLSQLFTPLWAWIGCIQLARLGESAVDQAGDDGFTHHTRANKGDFFLCIHDPPLY